MSRNTFNPNADALNVGAKSLRIVIADDEALARTRLLALLSDLKTLHPHEVVAQVASGKELIECVQTQQPDLVLSDIKMPGMSGLEAARHLAGWAKKNDQIMPAVVFVTAYDDFAIQAFEANAIDYLMKPVRLERLSATLARVEQALVASSIVAQATAQYETQELAPFPSTIQAIQTVAQSLQQVRSHFSVYERGRILLVPVSHVLYLRAENKYVSLRTEARTYLIEESLIKLEEEFSAVFIRIHRNALVSRARILGVEKIAVADEESGVSELHWAVILKNSPDRLLISRRQWSQIKALIKV